MRKISINCREPGRFCRAKLALLSQGLLSGIVAAELQMASAQEILLPEPPRPAPPPTMPREKDTNVIRRKEREQKAADEQKSEQSKKSQAVQEAQKEEAKEEAQRPRPFYGFIELSLLQPKAVVSQKRSNYVSDPTVHTNLYSRVLWSRDATEIQPWIGIRIAPFTGYGTQERLTARYGHTWLGPGVGFGRVTKPDDPFSDAPTRYFWLISFGIAAVQRLSDDKETAPPIPEDFRNTPWAYEPPGAWIESRWSCLFRGALSSGILIGAQSGRGKIFYYAGFTGAGFL